MVTIIRWPAETKLKKVNRTPSKVSASDVTGKGGTDSWAGEKKARIQSTPTSENLWKNVRADKTAGEDTAHAIDDVHEERNG